MSRNHQTAQFDHQTYHNKVEELFVRLEKSPNRPRRPVQINMEKAKQVLEGSYAITGLFGMCAGLGVLLTTHRDAGHMIFPAVIAMTGLGVLYVRGALASDTQQGANRQINKVLSVFGRTLPMNVEQAQDLNELSGRYPRIKELMAQWMSQTQNLELTAADYHKIKNTTDKVQKVYDKMSQDNAEYINKKQRADVKMKEDERHRSQVKSIFESTGVMHVAKKYRLGAIAEESFEKANPGQVRKPGPGKPLM